MSLVLKNRGVNSSLYTLGAGCFDKVNDADVAGARAPYGVLGGSVAALGDKSYEVVPGDGTKMAVGLFLNNAEGAPYENAPAVASGKVAICQKMASVEVDIYDAGVTFKVGDKLYSNADGYLTNVESTNKQVIGIVTKVPTAADPFLGLEMCI